MFIYIYEHGNTLVKTICVVAYAHHGIFKIAQICRIKGKQK